MKKMLFGIAMMAYTAGQEGEGAGGATTTTTTTEAAPAQPAQPEVNVNTGGGDVHVGTDTAAGEGAE